ncbi:F-box protein At2g32560-like [Andrographis paniculata]|uniref:F-box protein At2g32560-like n=1 Tax=Andrographis paniculata TaxID=175694 RepID=UPI0021E7F500|nr:F-box protein At2g32560-like [Andrographis paniculata]
MKFLNPLSSLFTHIKSSLLSLLPLPEKNPTSEPAPAPDMSPPSFLDLPDLVLECILQKLPSEGLCRMAAVCTALRGMSAGDHLWEGHLRRKWGSIISPNARREWNLLREASRRSASVREKGVALVDYLIHLWPLALIRSSGLTSNPAGKTNFPPPDSVMSWYLALERGDFWFPAQVYNRENGHIGFMLSCYDAELRYDRRSDTFQARYPPHGRRMSAIETGVTWNRLRAPPVETSPHDLHISDCLKELQPGDRIEIQWRRNKEFPYGWWYGVVGHLETCDRNPQYCRCGDNDTIVLEFNQYMRGSRWRMKTVHRKDHREEGNETDGFYGGIRKLHSNDEISTWEKLWPTQVLE